MDYIYFGKIVNTHGIKGEVRILSNFQYKSKVLKKYFPIYIGREKRREIISSYRPHKQFDMITMEGIFNINDVLKYKGKSVYIQREDLKLEKQEYLDEDLIGMDVIIEGRIVGKVVRFEKDRYQDKIVVNKEGKDYLVPYVCDIIKNVNLEMRTITLSYIKGLLGE